MEENQTPEPQTQPVPAEPTKKNTKKIIIIVVAVLLLLCCITAGIFGAVSYFAYKGISAPVDPIKKQLAALNNGDVDEAYNKYTSEEFKRQTSLDQFKQIVEDNPQIFKSKSSSFNNVSMENGEASVTGTITGKDGTVTKMAYKVVKEDGKWLIFGFQERK